MTDSYIKFPWSILALVDGQWFVASRHRARSRHSEKHRLKYVSIARKKYPRATRLVMASMIKAVEQHAVAPDDAWSRVRMLELP